MNYSDIIYFDTGNSHGISTTLFVSGCSNMCEQCHNPSTWNPNNGKVFDAAAQQKILNSLKNPHVKYLVLTGGDPFYPDNVKPLFDFVKDINDVEIIAYTGYTLKKLYKRAKREPFIISLLNNIDYIIDGKYNYLLATKTPDLRGSTNQHCYKRVAKNIFRDISNTYFKEKTEET